MEFVCCRAIIIKDEKLVVMEREKNGFCYYAFPGGHVEKGESNEDCVKREVLEEFGIIVEPQKLVYVYEFNGQKQAFYLSKWVAGKIHKTDAEEYQPSQKNGYYNPTIVSFDKLGQINLMPPEITTQLISDYKAFGKNLSPTTVVIKGKIWKTKN